MRLPNALLPCLFCAFFLNSQSSYSHKHDDTSVYFDLNVPEQETFLTPSDFAAVETLDLNDTDTWYTTNSIYNSDLFEGDITNDVCFHIIKSCLPCFQLNSTTVELFLTGGISNNKKDNLNFNAIRDRRQLWKNGRIPYALSSQYSPQSRAIIASAMDEYRKHTCIKWEPRTQFDNDYGEDRLN